MDNTHDTRAATAAASTTTTTGSTDAAAACAVGDEAAACGTAHWKGKTEAEWRQALTPEQYRIAREAGTERAFSGKYWDAKTPGLYACAGCGQPLFRSETKFDSGTGWPSYYAPVAPGAVSEHTDRKFGMARTEVKCGRCDAHLGHVFDDGPAPTGLRYCMNSAVLDLKPDGAGE